MARPKNHTPVYKLHSSTGLARCWVNGRWVTLGKYGSPESRAEFARILAELTAVPSAVPVAAVPSDVTVDQVLLAFLEHADRHYRAADGKLTDEVRELRRSFFYLHELYGRSPASQFGPRALTAVRQAMIGAGWCRTLINRRVDRIKRAFKWGASQELVSVTVYQTLCTLMGLYRGRTEAREAEPVRPVAPSHVEATLPFLTPHLGALVRFQQLTGCRPGEACRLRLADIDRTGEVWFYRPPAHKTAHRGFDRTIAIGPKAQAVLVEFMCRGDAPPAGFEPLRPGDHTARLVLADAYQEAGRERDAKLLRDLPRAIAFVSGCVFDPDVPLFSPAEAREERFRIMRAARKSRIQPSQRNRRKSNPKLVPALVYTPHTYTHAVRVAAGKAGVPHWHPNQLRHTFATEVRKTYGLEAAQVLLGHATADVTQIYAERDRALAVQVAAAVG